MPYRQMSLDDFARYVGMDARDVRKMADRGKLPAQKVGGEWRFNRARVLEWLQQEIPSLDQSRLVAIETAMRTCEDVDKWSLTSMIGLEGIDLQMPAKTKSSVLRELVGLAERTGLLYDKEGLLEALREREDMCSTALPKGIAIPHPRQPMPYVSAEPMICVARLPRGIGFGSEFGDRTDIFFLICCHDDRQHLHALARLMRVLDEDTINRIRETEVSEDLLKMLIERESQIDNNAAR